MATANYFDSNRTITEHFHIETALGHPVFLVVLLIDPNEMLQ